jgi:hypothetical protein
MSVMSDESRKLSITYSSGLIPLPEIMSTLAVFYDEIWLPQPYYLDIEFYSRFGELYGFFSKADFTSEYREALEKSQLAFYCLKTKWVTLYKEGILKTLRPLSSEKFYKVSIPSQLVFPDTSYEGIYKFYMDKVLYLLKSYADKSSSEIIQADAFISFASPILIGMHRVRQDKPSPELFISDPSDTCTSRLAGYLVHSLFQYYVPQLDTLNAEQILEVRDYLKDTKEGFTYYINQITDDVEQRIKSGNLTEMVAAQKTFERKILPLYVEFRRQLAAKKTGYWANVLAASADFFKVDATPWTPKFYGELLKWLGVVLNLTAKDEEALLTNQSQAFQYLATLEKKLS